MSGKKEFLEMLFRAHSVDLASLYPDLPDHFVCPICLHVFSHESLQSAALSDGHVWPDAIRRKSGTEKITLQRVLLCTECNNHAGSSGDKQMQLRELAKDAEMKGELYGQRKIEIVRGPAKKPIRLQGKIRMDKKKTNEGQMVFSLDKNKEWAGNNPKERERFEALGRDKHFSIIVHPFREMKVNLAEVGWITSAYLLAFYTFGYRYILNKDLDRVRDYIKKSFEDEPGECPKEGDFGLKECATHNYQEPEIGLMIPLDRETDVHLQISLFDYHIRLPFHHYVPAILSTLIQQNNEISGRLPELIGGDTRLYVPVMCNKMDGHECIWDYVLGKQAPL